MSGEIPKRIHQIWLGGEVWPGPKRAMAEVRDAHPGWEYKVWDGMPDDAPDYLHGAFNDCQFFSQRSDVLSYWLIWKYGGIYLDADFAMVKSLEPLLGRGPFCGRIPRGTLACASLGAAPASGAYGLLLDEVKRTYGKAREGDRCRYGPTLLRSVLRKNPDVLKVLPFYYFYIARSRRVCHNFFNGDVEFRKGWLERQSNKVPEDDPHVFAVHLWGFALSRRIRTGRRRVGASVPVQKLRKKRRRRRRRRKKIKP